LNNREPNRTFNNVPAFGWPALFANHQFFVDRNLNLFGPESDRRVNPLDILRSFQDRPAVDFFAANIARGEFFVSKD
jgi:hypothetical protein